MDRIIPHGFDNVYRGTEANLWLFWLALIRYRSMVPLLYVLLITNYLGHKAIGLMKPIPHAGGASGNFVSIGLAALTVLGLILSVVGRGYAERKRPLS